jgi:hypothetical protein
MRNPWQSIFGDPPPANPPGLMIGHLGQGSGLIEPTTPRGMQASDQDVLNVLSRQAAQGLRRSRVDRSSLLAAALAAQAPPPTPGLKGMVVV